MDWRSAIVAALDPIVAVGITLHVVAQRIDGTGGGSISSRALRPFVGVDRRMPTHRGNTEERRA